MKCVVCLQDNWIPYYRKLKKCRFCGLVRADDHYFKKSSKSIYTDDYFNGLDYLDYGQEELALSKNFHNRIQRIKSFKKRGKILDVGCAYGYFLKIANQNSFKANGIELNSVIARKAHEYSNTKVYAGDLAKLKIPKSSYDVITMLDTIEHFKTPDLYIAKSLNLLKKKGLLVIETGNIEALLPKIQKEKWRLVTPPTHLYYFSPETLRILLERLGFTVIAVQNVGFSRTIGQTIYRLSKSSFIRALFKPIAELTYTLHTFDLMFVIAQK